MKRQVGGRTADRVLRVFRIMPAQERPRAFSVVTMNVLDPWRAVFRREHGDPGLEDGLIEAGRHPVHEAGLRVEGAIGHDAIAEHLLRHLPTCIHL